ncbi:hypothetical protein H072_6341 [Dactylellina haptotyla CBS 200.50]|uniref:Uncharacterized protein n=1 Tax=Dactylellina haptotyla (strain CBS 200.50) TaxID=1284197 RepID=S8BKF1_DACHA|nr:hypothetical protein H072_6341 [Dactylellina haptotyla CBS 200.50]
MKFTATVLSLLAATASATQFRYDPRFDDSASLPWNAISCSDGATGFKTKYGIQNTQQLRTHLQPNVHFGAGDAQWNTKNCGQCWLAKSVDGKKSAYFTLIDNAPGGIQGGTDLFKMFSKSGTTFEGVVEVHVYEQPRNKCWKN